MKTHIDDQVAPLTFPVKSTNPHPWEMIIHPMKTLRFISVLGRDRRISLVRKLLYVVPIVLLLAALLLPESIIAAAVALALPVIGPIVNLPADGAVDWALIGLAAYALLGILPLPIVREYHARIFHPGRMARQRQSQKR